MKGNGIQITSDTFVEAIKAQLLESFEEGGFASVFTHALMLSSGMTTSVNRALNEVVLEHSFNVVPQNEVNKNDRKK